MAYGLAVRAAYGSFPGGGTAYGLLEAGAGDPDLEALERLPKREDFLVSRSPSFSPFFSPNGMLAVVFGGGVRVVRVEKARGRRSGV